MTDVATRRLVARMSMSTLSCGVVAGGIGVLLLRIPMSIRATAIIFAVYFVAIGVAQVMLALSLEVPRSGRILLFVGAAAVLISAALSSIPLSSEPSTLLLVIWIALAMVFRGVATIISAISDPTVPGRVWFISIGLASLVAGIIVFATPVDEFEWNRLGYVWLVLGLIEVISSLPIHDTG